MEKIFLIDSKEAKGDGVFTIIFGLILITVKAVNSVILAIPVSLPI